MDVNKIKSALSLGIVYDGMDRELQDLRDANVITSEEYYSLLGKLTRIENDNNKEENTLTISQYSSEREENTKPKEDNTDTNLNDVSGNPFTSTYTNESAEDEAAEERTNEEPVSSASTPNEENSTQETGGTKTEEWVSDYHNYMMEWSARNPERRLEKFEAEETSFKAEFKDGVALNFSSPSNVAVKAADPDSPKASDFDALIEIAKKSNQNIRLSDNMSPEFRKALIEACATSDVKIVNLSKEDAELYLSFVAKDNEETTEQQDVVDNSNVRDEAPAVENEEPAQEETETPVVEDEAPAQEEAETPLVEDEAPAQEENAPIPMPASFENEATDENDEVDHLFDGLELNDVAEEDEADHLFDGLELNGSAGETANYSDYVFDESSDQPSKETPAPTDEISAEEAPNEGWLHRAYNKAKDKAREIKGKGKEVKKDVSQFMVGLGTMAVVASSCANPKQKQVTQDVIPDTIPENNYEERTTPTDENTITWEQACDTVPAKWNDSMDISEREFNKLQKLPNWREIYTNAHLLKDTLKMSELKIIRSWYNVVAWTTSPNSKGDADYNSGILAPYGLENLSRALNCGDTLIVENIENYRIMLNAGNNDLGKVNAYTLSGIRAGFANLPHDAEGYIIGSTCNSVAFIYDCGSEKDVHYNMRACDCQNITSRVEVVLQQDTTEVQTPVVDTVAAPVVEVVDTVQTPPPAPKLKKVKPQPQEESVMVYSTTSLGKAPIHKFISSYTENESSISQGSRASTRSFVRKNKRHGVYDERTAEALQEEVTSPGTSKAKLEEKRRQAEQQQDDYTYEENGNTYNWTINQSEGR